MLQDLEPAGEEFKDMLKEVEQARDVVVLWSPSSPSSLLLSLPLWLPVCGVILVVDVGQEEALLFFGRRLWFAPSLEIATSQDASKVEQACS